MSTVQVDTINESTTGSGVTVDGVLIKDGQVDGVDVSTLSVDTNDLVKLASTTASNDAAITFDNFVDTSTYSHYKVVLDSILPETNNVSFQFKFRTGGASGADKTGTYARGYAYNYLETSSSNVGARQSTTDYGNISGNVGNAGGSQHALQASGNFFSGNGTNSTAILDIPFTQRQSTGNVVGYIQNAIALENLFTCTGLKFYMSSGNIASGSIHIYGVKK